VFVCVCVLSPKPRPGQHHPSPRTRTCAIVTSFFVVNEVRTTVPCVVFVWMCLRVCVFVFVCLRVFFVCVCCVCLRVCLCMCDVTSLSPLPRCPPWCTVCKTRPRRTRQPAPLSLLQRPPLPLPSLLPLLHLPLQPLPLVPALVLGPAGTGRP
jgi:hypothetical protein